MATSEQMEEQYPPFATAAPHSNAALVEDVTNEEEGDIFGAPLDASSAALRLSGDFGTAGNGGSSNSLLERIQAQQMNAQGMNAQGMNAHMRAEVLQHQASQRIHSTPNSRRNSTETDLRSSQQIRSPPASFHANSTTEEYEGEYDDIGLRSGHGTLKFSNGDTYRGGFLEGYRHGRGEIKFADGSKYNGAWEHDKYHGYGQRCFANGDMYIGHFDKGQRCGHGKFEYAKGDTYVGAWSNGKINGYGTYYHKNGDAYEGMFVNGIKNGPGKYSLVDGRLDISKYVNGQRRGVGLRLCAERKRAWTLVDGVLAEEISLSDAYKIQTEVGFGDD